MFYIHFYSKVIIQRLLKGKTPFSILAGGLRITGLTGIFHKEDWPLPTTGQLSLCSGKTLFWRPSLLSFVCLYLLRSRGYFAFQQAK